MAISARTWLALIGLPLVVGLVQWPFITVPQLPKAGAVPDSWALPAIPRTQPKKAIELLSRASPWGKSLSSTDAPSLNPPNWRILGMLLRGNDRTVVIRIDGQPEQRLKIGEALPDGSTILGIESNSLCLLVEGKRRRLEIYPRGSSI